MNDNQKLILARMGFYHSGTTDTGELPERLEEQGGYFQQQRMIKDKYNSFLRALKYSYQGAFISPVGTDKKFRALINPNKLKQDYDDKIISVDFRHDLKPGSVFNWVNTNTYWLIYLQELTELAYFRGDIRKCNYTIKWEDEDKNEYMTYAAVRGPVETKINYIQKEGISVDTPNHSLNILIPYTEASYNYFKRYAKFYLQEDQSICWRIEGVDSISMPGVIELNAVEYYINEFLDDDGIANKLDVKEIPPDADMSQIEGPTFIKPKITYSYNISLDKEVNKEDWSIKEPNMPVEITWMSETNQIISLQWNKNYSGQFTLQCGDTTKTIVVESLF